MPIRNARDFWAGAIYLALGSAVVFIGQGYALGSSERMGPGYFPTVLGAILAVFGIVSIGRSFIRVGDPIPAMAWRPLLLILGSIVLFGLLLPRTGLLIALPALIVVGALASRKSKLDATSVMAFAGLIAFCIAVFVKGLGMPMPLIGTWFGG